MEPKSDSGTETVANPAFLLELLRPAPLRVLAARMQMSTAAVLKLRHRRLEELQTRLVRPPLAGDLVLVRVPGTMTGTHRRADPVCLYVGMGEADVRTVASSMNPDADDALRILRRLAAPGARVRFRTQGLRGFTVAAPNAGVKLTAEKPPWREDPAIRAAWQHGDAVHRWLRQFRGAAVGQVHLYVAWHDALRLAHVASGGEALELERIWLSYWLTSSR